MISVIIPVYNAEKTIRKCVDSIEINDYKDIEVILIDDCSKDASWEICKELSDDYGNIKCFRNEKNRGVSYTRNRGIKVAKRKYTVFIDSDDWIDETYFSEFLNVMAGKENSMAICSYINHDEIVNGTTTVFKWTDFESIKKCDVKDVLLSLYEACLLQQLWNKIFDTELIKEHGIWFDEKISIGEDTRFVLEYVKKCKIKNMYLLNMPLYHYIRGQADSLMYKVGYESVDEPLKNMRIMYEILGYKPIEIDAFIQEKRQKQIELYAYLIWHNSGMKIKEKKRLIYRLDESQGRCLYKINQKLFYKEKIMKMLKKIFKIGNQNGS